MIYAFMVAFMVYLRTPNKMLHDWGEENMMLSFCLQTVVYLGVIVAAFLMGAAAWRWLTDKPFARMMKRFTTIYLASAVVSFVVTFAATFALTCFYLTAFLTGSGSAATADSAAGSPSLLIIVLFALAIVAATALCMAVSLPFAYLTPKYMLQEKGEKLRPWKSFKCGFRHMGSIFKMGFLGCLVILHSSRHPDRRTGIGTDGHSRRRPGRNALLLHLPLHRRDSSPAVRLRIHPALVVYLVHLSLWQYRERRNEEN